MGRQNDDQIAAGVSQSQLSFLLEKYICCFSGGTFEDSANRDDVFIVFCMKNEKFNFLFQNNRDSLQLFSLQ
jgi:hypothetical protein